MVTVGKDYLVCKKNSHLH